MGFCCPVCSAELKKQGGSLVCENSHLFDISKKGYVNLLLGHSGGLHGDSKQMLHSRSEFLGKGYYEPLREKIVSCVCSRGGVNNIEDCGCGDGYYTAAVQNVLPDSEILAVDISKDALKMAHKRDKRLKCAVASTFSLPIADSSQDAALNIFSPFVREEYLRTLKENALLIMAIPLENHLWELKKAVYDKPYRNSPHGTDIEGFRLIGEERVDFLRTLPQADLINLFTMTPYFIKTSEKDKLKLNGIEELKVSFSFGILKYVKAVPEI